MKSEKLLDAMGEIRDEWIEDARKPGVRRPSITLLAAVLVIGLLLSVGAFALADVDGFYEVLYAFSPRMAQALKPVQMSCVDNGIEMKVLSAAVEWDTARVFIGLHDLEEDRVDETCDLYDGYSIDLPSKSMISHCEFSSYDEATGTALFLLEVERGDGWRISSNKLTFRLNGFMSGKREYHGGLELDRSLIQQTPQTRTDFIVNGLGGRDDDYTISEVMVPGQSLLQPTEGVNVTGMGWVDGMLRIQVHYDRVWETDNHGEVYLLDAEGDVHWSAYQVSFWDEQRGGRYDEYLFEVTPEKLEEYEFQGFFSAGDQFHRGYWEITFPLE